MRLLYKIRFIVTSFIVAAGTSVFLIKPAYADSTLCTGNSFSTCINKGYTAHGYENNYNYTYPGTSYGYWRAHPGHNCTQYVGYMLGLNGDSRRDTAMGNATLWNNTIANNPAWGYSINGIPAVGAIAHWEGNDSNPSSSPGHVAYVEAVNGNTIIVSEDNYPSGPFRWRAITKNGDWPDNFLHIADVVSPTSPSTDADGDGVADINDILPTVPGLSNNRGAPINSSNLSGDYNGDGYQDVTAFYNYGSGITKLLTFYGTGNGNFATPVVSWSSSTGGWEWANTKPVSGDFDNDGKTDIMAFYDYGNSTTAAFFFKGQANNTFVDPTQEWHSGAGNVEWSRVLPIAGDFNGDGNKDASFLYDYNIGGGTYGSTGIVTFDGDGAGNLGTPYTAWTSGAGNWEWENTKPVVADFNSDGKSDIATFYDYGNETTGILLFSGSSAGTFATPMTKWSSSTGAWAWESIKPFTGDFDNDGNKDISLFYRYAVAGLTKQITFNGDGSGNFATPSVGWSSSAGGWEWNNTKAVAGDFTNDGKTDVAALYNYGAGSTSLFMFRSSTGGVFATPTSEWASGSGNWEWPNTLIP